MGPQPRSVMARGPQCLVPFEVEDGNGRIMIHLEQQAVPQIGDEIAFVADEGLQIGIAVELGCDRHIPFAAHEHGHGMQVIFGDAGRQLFRDIGGGDFRIGQICEFQVEDLDEHYAPAGRRPQLGRFPGCFVINSPPAVTLPLRRKRHWAGPS